MENSKLCDHLQAIEELLVILVAAIIIKPLGLILLVFYLMRNAIDYMKGRS